MNLRTPREFLNKNWKCTPPIETNKTSWNIHGWGAIERNGAAWTEYTFTFTAPGEDFPIHFRIDVDAAGLVLLVDPKLMR